MPLEICSSQIGTTIVLLEEAGNRFRCIVGCSGLAGPGADQLNLPQSLSFDNVGNLYVVDRNNDRIQKFDLGVNICGKCIDEKKAIKIEKHSFLP